MLNSSAVTIAPNQTSCQATSVSGNHLKSMANNAARIARETMKLIASQSVEAAAASPPTAFEIADRVALRTSAMVSKNPSASTPANDTRYVRAYHHMLTSPGSSTFQMVFMASFNWATTPTAEIRIRKTPTNAAA